jgi:hypothetical protein
LFILVNGRVNRIRSAANNASTPPSLFGIDRRIAYTHRKYHSGLMWMGVTRGFARRKLSGSDSMLGAYRTIVMNRVSAIINPRASFVE